jgi:flagellar biosynthesis/type III secretory pathway chaperone
MENIYQQAIADAKALRASAMANAKSALQEAFEPQIKEMVRLKLSEELDEVEELEETEEMEEGMDHEMEEGYDGVEETLGEGDLDEILAELDALSEEDSEELEESEDLEEAEETEEDETEDEDALEFDDTEGNEDAEETKEITVSLGDLKDLIDKIKGLNPELASDEMADDEEGLEDMEASEEDLEGEEEVQEETFSLDEILAELEEDSLEEKVSKDKKEDKVQEELNEAKHTIAELTQSLNEVNLLNAKLLYMNKIFKAKSLTESQKIQVVKAFDKATSVKEVKNTFEILKESVNAKKKSQIHESFGYASKPAGVSPNANVIDADPFVNRWQKLAGL